MKYFIGFNLIGKTYFQKKRDLQISVRSQQSAFQYFISM